MDDIEKTLEKQLSQGPPATSSGFVPTDSCGGPNKLPRSKMIPTYVDENRRTHVPSQALNQRPNNVPREHVQDEPYAQQSTPNNDMNEWFAILEQYTKANDEKLASLEARLASLEAIQAAVVK